MFTRTEAQSPAFYLGFDHILDNREYFTRYASHQTIFGARINPGVRFPFDSVHSVSAGINYMYEYGGTLLGVIPQLDLYYRYEKNGLLMHFGSFPRKELLHYTLFLLADSIGYYRPNIEGSSIIYRWQWGRVHGWVDWTGRASEETRESILAGVDLTLSAGWFYFSTTTTRYHLARSKAADDTHRIRDDGSILVLGGIDLSEQIPLDLADLAAGVAITYERTMPSPSEWYRGWFARLKLKYSILGLMATWYKGERSPLRYGDPLYTSGNYGRIDLSAEPLHNSRISSRFAWNFHMLPGEGLFHSQQIVICIHL